MLQTIVNPSKITPKSLVSLEEGGWLGADPSLRKPLDGGPYSSHINPVGTPVSLLSAGIALSATLCGMDGSRPVRRGGRHVQCAVSRGHLPLAERRVSVCVLCTCVRVFLAVYLHFSVCG